MKEKIFFAHANGFPAEVYSDLFSKLPDYEFDYIPVLAHGEYKLKHSWSDIVPEIIAFFEKNYTEPVWAIGHSEKNPLKTILNTDLQSLKKELHYGLKKR